MVRGSKLEDLIGLLVREGAVTCTSRWARRPLQVQGLLTPVEGYGVLDPPDTEAFLAEIIPEPWSRSSSGSERRTSPTRRRMAGSGSTPSGREARSP